MSKIENITQQAENITADAVKIDYLLSNAIYKTDDEREASVLSEIALKFAKIIKNRSEKIVKTLMKDEHF